MADEKTTLLIIELSLQQDTEKIVKRLYRLAKILSKNWTYEDKIYGILRFVQGVKY